MFLLSGSMRRGFLWNGVPSTRSIPPGFQKVAERRPGSFRNDPATWAAKMATSPVLIASFIQIFDKVHGGSFTEPEISDRAPDRRSDQPLRTGRRPSQRPRSQGRSLSSGRGGDARWPVTVGCKARRAFGAGAHALIEQRGRLDEDSIERFVAVGYRNELVLEVITIVAASTITNYTGNVTNPPLEPMLQSQEWKQ